MPASQTSEALADDLAIYESFLRTEDNTGTVVSASTLRVAFDRVTSELSNCCGANFDGREVEFSGINPLKFPMFTEPGNTRIRRDARRGCADLLSWAPRRSRA